MRWTSARRRQGTGGRRYDGRGYQTPKVETPTKVLPEGTPGSVVCKECGVRVLALKAHPDTPISHAAGGYATNIQKGRFRCAGSGTISHTNLPGELQSEDGKPILEEFQAREQKLINAKIIAARYDIAKTTVTRISNQGIFVPVVAYLRHETSGYLQPLFKSTDVAKYMQEHGMRRRTK